MIKNILLNEIVSHELNTPLQIQGDKDAFLILQNLPNLGLCVVGTREPALGIQNLIKTTLLPLKGSSIVLISGLARGIDAIAHKTALEMGIKTIAVLPTALDDIYPKEHLELTQQIIKNGGLLITPFKSGERLQKWHFSKRNDIMAKLAKATWIVQAPRPSGALKTATSALSYGRHCLVTSCFPADKRFEGNRWLLEDRDAEPLYSHKQICELWPDLISQSKKTKLGSQTFSETLLSYIQSLNSPVPTQAAIDHGLLHNKDWIEVHETLESLRTQGLIRVQFGEIRV